MAMTGFSHSVTWPEFRKVATRPSRVPEDAFIKANKSVDYTWSRSGGSYTVGTVTGTIAVSPAESWVVRGHETAGLLAHEQGHFDITALGMREEHDRTSALTGTSEADLDSQYQTILREINAKVRTTNERYDTQTAHGRNAAAQARWQTAIRTAKGRAGGTIADLPR